MYLYVETHGVRGSIKYMLVINEQYLLDVVLKITKKPTCKIGKKNIPMIDGLSDVLGHIAVFTPYICNGSNSS